MALEDIRQHIKEKAADEVRDIKERSATELSGLEDDWKTRIEEERKRLLGGIDRLAASALAQAKFEVREHAKAELLRSKTSQIDKVFDDALKELADLPKGEYVDVLVPMLKEIGDQDGVVLTSEDRAAELAQAMTQAGCKKAHVADERIDTVGGFVFRSKSIDRDCRFETMLKRIREDSMMQVNDLLFNR